MSRRPRQVFPRLSPAAPLSLDSFRDLAIESIWAVFTKSRFADGSINIKTHYHTQKHSLLVKVWDHFQDLAAFISSVIPEGERNGEGGKKPGTLLFHVYNFAEQLAPPPEGASSPTCLSWWLLPEGSGPKAFAPLSISCNPL